MSAESGWRRWQPHQAGTVSGWLSFVCPFSLLACTPSHLAAREEASPPATPQGGTLGTGGSVASGDPSRGNPRNRRKRRLRRLLKGELQRNVPKRNVPK